MKLFIPLLFILVSTFCTHAQRTPSQIDTLATNRLIDAEKRAWQFSSDAASRGDRVASSENFDVNFYRCEWRIDPAVRYISGKVTSYFTITQATDNITFDLSDTLIVDSVLYRTAAISFQRAANDGLLLKFPSALVNGQKDSVSVFYHGVPKIKTTYQSFTQKTHSGVPVVSTLSEPYGAKEWWPCKNGLTDKADSLDVIITSPSAYKGIANGVLVSDITTGNERTVYYKHRYPIASYLLGMAVSNYITARDSIQTGTKFLPVLMNSYPEDEFFFKDATFYAIQSMGKFTQLFGEYPFIKEQYSQTECNLGGGMEHQTNSFIGDNWNQLVAHELGHHWFGDHVTCGSWQHIWLNEGFGNYMQFIYVQNFDTSLITAHLTYYLNLVTSAPGGSVFVPDTTNPSRVFDNRLTYAKGGYVLHMLRGILGDSIFFKGLRQYLNDPIVKNKFAYTADLQRNLELVSGKNLQSFFQKWIYGEGYPNYNATWTQNINNWVKVQLNQTTSHPSVSFYEMPVQLEFRNNDRDTIITVNNQQNGEIFWIDPGFAADTMIIDPKLWILAKDRIVKKILPQTTLPDNIKIYPNPAPDHLVVSLLNPTSKKLSIRLFNATGQLVYGVQKELVGQDELITIPMQRFAGGAYILKIYDDKGIKASKTIIK